MNQDTQSLLDQALTKFGGGEAPAPKPETGGVQALLDRAEGLKPRDLDFWDAAKEWWDNPSKSVPFLGAGVDAWKMGELLVASNAMSDGSATKAQEDLVYEYLDTASRGRTVGNYAISILSELPAFVGEIAATFGAYTTGATAGRIGGRRALAGALGGAIEASIAKGGVRKTAAVAGRRAFGQAAGATVGAGLQATHPLMSPRLAGAIVREALPEMTFEKDDLGKASVVFGETTDDFVDWMGAGFRGFMRTWIELVSERTGSALGKVPPIPQIHHLQAKLLAKYAEDTGKPFVEAVKKLGSGLGVGQGVGKSLAKRTGWDGVAEEWGEERVAAALGSLLLGDDPSGIIPDRNQALGELVAFGLGGTAMKGASKALAGGGSSPAGSVEQGEVPRGTSVEQSEGPVDSDKTPAADPDQGVLSTVNGPPVRERVKKPTPTAAHILESVAAQQPQEVELHQVLPSGDPSLEADVEFARRLGLEPVFFETGERTGLQFPAALEGSTVAVHAGESSETRRRSLLYHEVVHHLEAQHNDSFNELADRLQKIDPEGVAQALVDYERDAEGLELSGDQRTGEKYARYVEGIGEYVEAVLSSPAKLAQLNKRDAGLLEQIVQAVVAAARKIGINIPHAAESRPMQAARVFADTVNAVMEPAEGSSDAQASSAERTVSQSAETDSAEETSTSEDDSPSQGEGNEESTVETPKRATSTSKRKPKSEPAEDPGEEIPPKPDDALDIPEEDIRFAAAPAEDSEAFLEWFGDSKVVDAQGRPLRVFHGTNARFFSFARDKIGSTFEIDEDGFYFTSDEYLADQYAEEAVRVARRRGVGGDQTTVAAYISMENPWIIEVDTSKKTGKSAIAHFESGEGQFDRGQQALVRYGADAGYDGIIIRDVRGIDRDHDALFIAFSPTQIKSATQNLGTFSKTDPDIRFAAARTIFAEDVEVIDKWLANRDVATQKAEIRARQHEEELMGLIGVEFKHSVAGDFLDSLKGLSKEKRQELEQIDSAGLLYIDLLNAENKGLGSAEEVYRSVAPNLSEAQRAWFQRSQEIGPEAMKVVSSIVEENREQGEAMTEAEVLESFLEAYAARIWAPLSEEDVKAGKGAALRMHSGRQEQRTYPSILHGWADGRELRVSGMVEAQRVASIELSQVLYNKQLVEMGQKAGIFSTDKSKRTDDGEPWVMLKDESLRAWVWSAEGVITAPLDGPASSNLRVQKGLSDDRIFELRPLYAEPKTARFLNNVLGESTLDGGFWSAVTKWNAMVKELILTTSLFHHQAFIRSFLYGSPWDARTGLNLGAAYKEGRQAVFEFGPELELLVRRGLTLGRLQDYEKMLAREKTKVGKVLDRVPMLGSIKTKLEEIQDNQSNYLFKRLGPYLKAQSSLLEFRHLKKKHKAGLLDGTVKEEDLAKIAADISNDDFGGLNLARMGRNPTTQHIFRILALAPDWTESNVRSMVNAFKSGNEGAAYRQLWGRVIVKAGAATVLFNILMSAIDDEDFWDRYQRAWDEGKLRWLEADITPIYKALGGEDSESRKYFSVLGHFRDPIKFILHPARSAKHKSSVFAGLVLEALEGTDWAGRGFTSFDELMGFDDKGVYKTTKKGSHRAGDPKGGKLAGQTVGWRVASKGAIDPQQVPSFLLNQLRGMTPIQMQNAMAWLGGDMDGFSAITKSLGLMTSQSYKDKQSTPETLVKQLEADIKMNQQQLRDARRAKEGDRARELAAEGRRLKSQKRQAQQAARKGSR